MRIVVTKHLSATPERVWDYIAAVERHVEWMVDATEITVIGSQRRGVGTRMDVLTRIGPFRTNDIMEFTAWDPPHRMAIRHQGLVTGTGTFHLAADKQGTLFTWDERLRFPTWLGGGVTARLAAPVLRWVWRRNLRQLAAHFDPSTAA